MRDLVSEEVFRIRFRFQAPLDGFSHFSKRGREKEKIDSLLVSYVIPSPHLVLMRGQKESTANLKHPTSTLPPPPFHTYICTTKVGDGEKKIENSPENSKCTRMITNLTSQKCDVSRVGNLFYRSEIR